jgi:hypothetical protein
LYIALLLILNNNENLIGQTAQPMKVRSNEIKNKKQYDF